MALQKQPHRRSQRSVSRKKKRRHEVSDYDHPRISPPLRSVFRQIGTPEPGPFTPDPFQREALELIRRGDVLVSAATGSGKTWIAAQAIQQCLSENRRVWYASPLKALSNAIFQNFCQEFGASHCGILTGDRKENPDAPVIVGTTEILRNQLYDAMHQGARLGTDLVILDEAHYLSDPDRGVVWEEVFIYLPARIRLLLLSATISNAEALCGWLEEIRGIPIRLVRALKRPVPLKTLFLFPDGLVTPLSGRKGLSQDVKKYLGSRNGRRGLHPNRMDFGKMLSCLRTLNLLPAIFFLKSRMDCDRALQTCPPVQHAPHMNRRIGGAVHQFLKDYPHLENHRQMKALLKARVGSHHGGQLPYWKVLIEKMMNRGYLEAIFSTSTVAAGVNFPARTVVLVQSDRFNGREFLDLTATEFHQMIGRAGRRGKDHIGFCLLIPGLHQDPQLIHDLTDSPPDPVVSRIHINFSMTLNLLLSHAPSEVRDLLGRSFAAFEEKRSGASLRHRLDGLTAELVKALPEARCDASDPYEILEHIQNWRDIQSELNKKARAVRSRQFAASYREFLRPGRLFLHKNGKVYALFEVSEVRGRLICKAHNTRKRVRTRKRGPKLSQVDLTEIRHFFDFCMPIPEEFSAEKLQQAFDAIPVGALTPLDIEKPSRAGRVVSAGAPRERLEELPCARCEHFKTCRHAEKGRVSTLLREFRVLNAQMDGMDAGLWLSFKRHLRFLGKTGFVDADDRLTTDGLWASKLRVDQPLLIAEAIRRGALEALSPEHLAGALAPFVWDRVMDVALRMEDPSRLDEMAQVFDRVLGAIEPIRALKRQRGFESPPLLFWPAVALSLWTGGMAWNALIEQVPVDEGDMASLLMRTADHLRQVANLRKTHPDLAGVAIRAVDRILREPVYFD